MPNPAFLGKSGMGPRCDLILEIDDTVGQLMRLLEEKGIRDNTLIVFTSDNGPDPWRGELAGDGHKPAGLLRGQKADIWEGGHRVPFIASWPARIPSGTASSELICLTDLLATCAAIAQARLPDDAGEDSLDLLPELTGQKRDRPVRESVVLQAYDGTLALRQGDWKYIRGAGGGGFDQRVRTVIGIPHSPDREVKPGDPQVQLYHIQADPGESDNVWQEHAERLAFMSSELERQIEAGRTRPADPGGGESR